MSPDQPIVDHRLVVFENLCQESADAYCRGEDALGLEPFYLAVLWFLKANQDLAGEFEQRFVERVLDPREQYMPLLQFCMHELRWNSVLQAAHQVKAKATTSKIEHWMNRIIQSYSSEWTGLRLYDYYRPHP